MEPGLADGAEISFSIGAQAVGTKGLINPTSSTDPGLAVQGTQLHVYDYLTGFTGTVGGVDYDADDVFPYINGTLQYINETPGEKNENYWQFVDSGAPAFYRWTKTGVHNFFAWLVKDMSGNPALTPTSLFGSELTLTDARVLNVPQVSFTQNSPQFDFLYSNIVERNMADAGTEKYATVPLRMEHLFTALAVSLQNLSADEATIRSVKLVMVNGKSAEISFAGTDPVLTYSTSGNTTGNIFRSDISATSTVVLGENDHIDLLSANNAWTEPNYILMWPQTVADITNTDDASDLAKIVVEYTIEGHQLSTTIPLSSIAAFTPTEEGGYALERGKKYDLTLQFINKSIEIVLRCIPWDSYEETLTYSEGDAIANAVALEYSSGAYVTSGGGRRRNNWFANATDPINAYFYVYSPVGAKWRIKVSGATDKFTVASTTQGATASTDGLVITGNISDRVDFSITRNGATADDAIQINFYVVVSETVDGAVVEREISINSEITRRNALTITGKVGE